MHHRALRRLDTLDGQIKAARCRVRRETDGVNRNGQRFQLAEILPTRVIHPVADKHNGHEGLRPQPGGCLQYGTSKIGALDGGLFRDAWQRGTGNVKQINLKPRAGPVPGEGLVESLDGLPGAGVACPATGMG